MKNIILGVLLLTSLTAWADGAASTNAASAAKAPDEKEAAIQLSQDMGTLVRADDSSQESWDAIDAKLDGYQKQFGVTPQTTNNIVKLRRMQLNIAKKTGGDARNDALVQKLSTDPNPEVAALVAKLVTLKTKPLDLKYTAVDGTAVDLAQMRGKVVLVDFWATWCGPCVEEVPNVVAAYQKYHDKGFEVVGVSLDKDKDAMLAFTKQNGMTWPQYFDGKAWSNDISTSYGIHSIPAMWLIGKDGMLISTDAREDFAGQVEKALAAK